MAAFPASALRSAFPWVKFPLIVSAPMLNAATPALALSVSRAGGIGFLAGGTNLADLDRNLEKAASSYRSSPPLTARHSNILPIGIGFQNWGCDLSAAVKLTKKHLPAVVWFYAPKKTEDLKAWAEEIRSATESRVQVWVQVGTVKEAVEVMRFAKPDVLVLQGTDAGGHGLIKSASIISLLPEVADTLTASGVHNVPLLAAGGIVDGRGVAAAIALGASGTVLGTRFLAAEEAGIPQGWKKEILRAADGGLSTGRSTLCDRLKGTVGWPAQYDGRAILNKGHEDMEAGMTDEQNSQLYREELKQGDEAWGPHGRMVAYAGTGVGLIKKVMSAKEIVDEVSAEALDILHQRATELPPKGSKSKL
ncbi:oxidoreductase-like protein [Xylogone sp. PMI_703]|nr:oxidoreductase-like protein [Xylogone sp. PMI_703]